MVVQERIRGGERRQCGAGGQADGGVRVRRRAVGPAPARPRRHHASRMDTAQIASQRSDHHDRLRERQHGGGGYQTGSFRLSRETGQPRNTARKNDRGGYTARTAPFTAGNAVRFGARNGYRMGTQRSVRQAPGSPVARRADQHVGSDHGRKRHGQGIRGPLHPRQQQAEGPSVRRRRLRRALARAGRQRAVRTCQRSLYVGRFGQKGRLRDGGRRNRFPRRDRQPALRRTGTTAPRDSGTRDPSRRQREGNGRRRTDHRRDEREPARSDPLCRFPRSGNGKRTYPLSPSRSCRTPTASWKSRSKDSTPRPPHG